MMKKMFLAVVGLVFSGAVMAEECTVDIHATDQMTWDQLDVHVSGACKEFTVRLHHDGKLPKTTMGHGWVLTKVNDKAGVLAATAAAGASNNYVPPNDPRVIAFIPLVGGGETHEVTIDTSKLKHGEEYLYFCPFPGHSATMKGELFFG